MSKRLLLLACLLTACTAAPAATGGFTGARHSDAAFTSTDDGCTYSFLYTGFVASWPPAPTDGAAAQPAQPQQRSAGLNAPDHVAGANVRIAIRGAAIGAPGEAGSLTIEFAGAESTEALVVPAEGESGSFEFTLTAPAQAGLNDLRLTLSPSATAPSAEQQVHIDSADLAIADAPFCRGDRTAPS